MPKSKNRGIRVRIAENEPEELAEALTVKNQAKGLLRSIAALLGDKALPSGVRKSLETASEAMRKTWADLEVEANSEETTAEETIKQEDGKWFLYSKDGKEKLGGPYDSEDEAIKREKQVLAFKDKEKENTPVTEAEQVKPNVSEAYDSLDGMAQRVRSAFTAQYPQLFNYDVMHGNTWWVADVYAGHPEMGNALVAHDGGKCYAISYTMDESGNYIFAPRSEWLEVVMPYKPVTSGNMAQLETESETVPQEDAISESFTESFEGVDITMVEAETPQLDANRAPLSIDVALIKPGFGNKKDNHYYSAEMLKQYAKVFEGAKMYLTDHKENERSVRNEVSVIDTVDRFREDGAPIARVTVFDPAFAESVRARAQAGKLDTLECSILADGTARKGMMEGREAKIVESIASVRAVDWVTRAGAGGHAMNIAESETTTPDETPAPIAETTPPPAQTRPPETPPPR